MNNGRISSLTIRVAQQNRVAILYLQLPAYL